MNISKIRYYISGTIFIIISFACSLSIYQQLTENLYYRNVLVLDFFLIAIFIPLGIFLIIKGKRVK